jgi:hypothetical protein
VDVPDAAGDDPYGLLGESSENGVAAGNDDEWVAVVTPPAASSPYPASPPVPPDGFEMSGPVMFRLSVTDVMPHRHGAGIPIVLRHDDRVGERGPRVAH